MTPYTVTSKPASGDMFHRLLMLQYCVAGEGGQRCNLCEMWLSVLCAGL